MASEVVVVQRRRRYRWPEVQLNIWIFIQLVAAGFLLGVFADFLAIQQQLRLGTPWLFPYMITVASLTLLAILVMLILINQRMLLPGVIVLASFILFVLWLTGLIETAIQLYGPANVNGNCNRYVYHEEQHGQSLNTLAWLEQYNICNLWRAAFAFEIIGSVFFFWMMIMAWQVSRETYDM
ncbi:MAG: hypothetical protein M1834_006873 [Cirrosporium novae-zelandiae]|nr:MAG: hypothetical protein M1834_006873 [Cirrosporium novae-zelandiae]